MTLKEMFFLGKRDKGVILGIGVAVMALVVLLIPDSESPKGNGKGIAERKEKKDPLHYATEEKVVRLTAFDPNTADSTLLLQLGLQPWQVRSVYKFRAHGGVYMSGRFCPSLWTQRKEIQGTATIYPHCRGIPSGSGTVCPP